MNNSKNSNEKKNSAALNESLVQRALSAHHALIVGQHHAERTLDALVGQGRAIAKLVAKRILEVELSDIDISVTVSTEKRTIEKILFVADSAGYNFQFVVDPVKMGGVTYWNPDSCLLVVTTSQIADWWIVTRLEDLGEYIATTVEPQLRGKL